MPDGGRNRLRNFAAQLNQFAHTIQPGDLVVMPRKVTDGVAIGEILGDCLGAFCLLAGRSDLVRVRGGVDRRAYSHGTEWHAVLMDVLEQPQRLKFCQLEDREECHHNSVSCEIGIPQQILEAQGVRRTAPKLVHDRDHPFLQRDPLERNPMVSLLFGETLQHAAHGFHESEQADVQARLGRFVGVACVVDQRGSAGASGRGLARRLPGSRSDVGVRRSGTRQRHPSGRTGALAQFGRVGWHSSGRPKGPDSRAELSLSVVECR